MASDGPSPVSSSGTRRRTRKVTVQHTLDRVRNNQRRHRARQKDYIAMLQEKLGQSEQSIMELKDQVAALRAELAQFRHQGGNSTPCATIRTAQIQNGGDGLPAQLPSTGYIDFQKIDPSPSTADLKILTLSTSLPFQSPVYGSLVGGLDPQLIDVIPTNAESANHSELAESNIGRPHVHVPPIQSPTYGKEISFGATGVGGSGGAPMDPATQLTDCRHISENVTTAEGTCCTGGQSHSSDSSKVVQHSLGLTQENTPWLPSEIFEPATVASYAESSECESTMLCAEAYILIAQQNFKGLNDNDITGWLWSGFRKSSSPSEGCRVQTNLVFNLLTFINDV